MWNDISCIGNNYALCQNGKIIFGIFRIFVLFYFNNLFSQIFDSTLKNLNDVEINTNK